MNFRNVYVSKSKTFKTACSLSSKVKFLFRRMSSVIFSLFLIFHSLVNPISMCCYEVYAGEAVLQPLQTGALWDVINGTGATAENAFLTEFAQDSFMMSVDMFTGYAFMSLAYADYWEHMNAEIQYKIRNGTLDASDVGYVYYKEVDGQQIPVAVVRSAIYGTNEYLITKELAEQIIEDQITEQAELEQAVLDYWNNITINSAEQLVEISANAENWVVELANDMSDTARDVYARMFGRSMIEPSADFFQSGIWAKGITQSDQLYQYNIGSSVLNPEYIYCVIHCPDIGNGRTGWYLWYYNPAWENFFFQKATDITPYQDFFKHVAFPPGMASTTRSYEEYLGMIQANLWPEQISFRELFPGWDGLAIMDPAVPEVLAYTGAYGLDDTQEAVQALTQEAEDAVEVNPGGMKVFDPATVPELVGVLNPDPYIDRPADSFPAIQDGDVVVTPPGGGGNDDPGEEEQPELKLPVLGGLFPFCIPLDIYNCIRALNTRSQEPIWDIPINISLSERPLVNTTLHIDLTSNGLDAIFSALRVVQVLAFIIGLGLFTKRFIF